MHRKILLYFLFVPLLIIAQFYNGHQMTFGKNRVQYRDFFWQYYRYPKYDIYFYTGGEDIASYLSTLADDNMNNISKTLNYQFERRIIFIVYNSQSAFKQTNIGLSTAEEQYNIGGVTQLIDNKIVLFFNGDHNDLKMQLRTELARMLIQQTLYGAENARQLLVKSISEEYPDWVINGMAMYVAAGWTAEQYRDYAFLLQNGDFKKINQTDSHNADVVACALFAYISEMYGEGMLGSILYLTNITKDINKGIYYVLGQSLKTLIKDAGDYYRDKYRPFPDSVTQDVILCSKKKKQIISFALNKNDSLLAYSTNEQGRLRLFLYDVKLNKRKRIYKDGHILEQQVDNTFPVLLWHPSGKLLIAFYEKEGTVRMGKYDVDAQKWEEREFFYFDKVLSAAFSKDGYKIVFSGVRYGHTDIWIHTLASHTNERVTDDPADDIFPTYSEDNSSILFSSDRTVDSCINKIDSLALHYDLYEYNLFRNSQILRRITDSKYDDETRSVYKGADKYMYLSNASGLENLYYSEWDSTITSIDTSIHYSYKLHSSLLSNEPLGIGAFQAQFDTVLFALQSDANRYSIVKLNIKNSIGTQLPRLFYKEDYIRSVQEDSVATKRISEKQIVPQPYIKNDSSATDIDNYIFDSELYFGDLLDSVFQQDENPDKKKPSVYQTNFYLNEVVNQIDFNFLNLSYQPFTDGGLYYTPGINMFIKFGVIDLFEDYRLTGGYKFSGSFESNELLLSYENLKKRVDKQLIFHRKSLISEEYPTYSTGATGYEMHKVQDNELMYIIKYPFDQVQSVRITPGLRYDRDIRLAYENLYSLQDTTERIYWFECKLDYIFDNSRSKGLNLYQGIRAKAFIEYYNQIKDIKQNLLVWGGDFRKYFKLHRNIIWANRFAYSGGIGSSPLLYYLGSVDNWINIFSGYDTYNEDIEYDKSVNWAYQALATNMRGFNRNVRNGTSFAVFNSELRVPVFSYLFNRPFKRDIINDFQIIGFCDIGAAWYGVFPKKENNAYSYEIIENDPVTVIIDKDYSPVVFGYGFGARTKIFGYFLKADWAWGIDDGIILEKIFYLSVGLDF